MDPASGRAPPPPGVQRIRTQRDLSRIVFTDGVAALEIPVELLRHVRFKNDARDDTPRLRAVARSIRRDGFRPVKPIVCRIGQKGRWIVVDGGHRLTAARQVASEWWANLFGRKVRSLYFILFEGPRSWKKRRPDEAYILDAEGDVMPVAATRRTSVPPPGAGSGEVESVSPPASRSNSES